MSNSYLTPVQSNPTVNFLDALAAASALFTPPFAAGAMNNLIGLPPYGPRRYIIRAISYVCLQPVGLEFDFYSSALGNSANAQNTFIGRYQFGVVNGVEEGLAPPYLFYADGMALPYFDADSANSLIPPLLHVLVRNCDVNAKSAGAPGAMTATIYLESQQAF